MVMRVPIIDNTISTDRPPPEYKCIKKSIFKVFKNPEYIKVIQDAVMRTNRINVKKYLLIALFIYTEYNTIKNLHSDYLEELPTKINREVLNACQYSIQKKSKGGNTPKGKTLEMIIKFKELQSKISKDFELEDASYLSQILIDETTTMMTAIENNIKQHFLNEYINRLVNATFQLHLSKDKPNLRKELIKVKDDLRNHTTTCDAKYHEWLNKYRYFILPKKFNLTYKSDIENKPQKYLSHMIWINLELERLQAKLFQVIPLRKSIINSYVPIDTTSLVKLFTEGKEQTDFLDNITLFQQKIWDRFTNKMPSYNEDYPFSFALMTDGFGCSLRYIEKQRKIEKEEQDELKRQGRKKSPEEKVINRENKKKKEEEKRIKEEQQELANEIKKQEIIKLKELKSKLKETDKVAYKKLLADEKQKKEEQKMLKVKQPIEENIEDENLEENIVLPTIEKTNIDFLYFTEVNPEWLEKQNLVFSDNGKNSLFHMRNQYGDVLNYTNRTNLHFTRRLQFQKRIEKEKERLGITEKETELSLLTSRSCNVEKFTAYCSKKLEVNKALIEKYNEKIFRQYRWYGMINRKREDARFLNDIERTFGKDAVIIMGDASVGVSMRHFISTPNKRMKRIIQQRFIVLLVDEFRTSIINWRTLQYQEEHFKYTDKTGKSRQLHSVLLYQTNLGKACINRDNNAVHNNETIVKHYFNYCKGLEENPRPFVFRRDVKREQILKIQNGLTEKSLGQVAPQGGIIKKEISFDKDPSIVVH